MKKILFVCDCAEFPTGAFEFIRQMNQMEHLFVKGIFFPPIELRELISISYIPNAGPYAKLKEAEFSKVRESQDHLKRLCQEADIKFQIDGPVKEWDKNILIQESRFADLVVLGSTLFCNFPDDPQPSLFMEDALRVSECPVIAIPKSYSEVTRLIVAYNSSKDSVFAIKQFTYLFPWLTDLPTEIVFVGNGPNDGIPDLGVLETYASGHFGSMGVERLQFATNMQFVNWLEQKKNALLVTGSFARSAVSNLVKPSFAEKVIGSHCCPVFTAHHI